MSQKALTLVQSVTTQLRQSGQSLATVESCSGGGLAYLLTSLPGSSDWFQCGYVTYSNEAKHRMVGVELALIEKYGAVSEPVACAMAAGGVRCSSASYALSVTGVAGPGGASPSKPVGMVCFGFSNQDHVVSGTTRYFKGSRQQIRRQSIEYALTYFLERQAL